MKTLGNLITSLENKINQHKEAAPAAWNLELAKHLVLANTKKSKNYLLKVLQLEEDAESEIAINAKILLALNAMSKLATDEALSIIEEAINTAEKRNYTGLLIHANAVLSLIKVYTGKANEAIEIINECIAETNAFNNAELRMEVLSNAAFVFMDKDLAKSGELAFEVLSMAKESEKPWLIGYAHAILGYWASNNKVEDDSYFHFKEAKKYLSQQGADEYYSNVLMQLSVCEKDRGNYQEALALLKEAETLLEKIENERLVIINAMSLGRLHRAQKNYDKAEPYYIMAYNIALENNIKQEAAAAAVFLGHLKRDEGQPEIAIHWFEKAIEIFGVNIRPTTKSDIAKHLHALYYKIGNFEKAYQTLLNYTEIRLQLQDENRIKETALLQTKYEAEKREAELKEALLKQTESELKALKAQMNPHFIFNALNSIQEIFFLGDKRLANKHLSQFSQLTRKILHASGKTYISLHEEIEMLEQYLSLEALRFSNDFIYSIQVDDTIDVYIIELPPLLIQPYVENAIKHGLMHKASNKKLYLNFSLNENENYLAVTVEDNGIGRTASEKINKNKQRIGASFASEATAKRLSLINKNIYNNTAVVYTDLADENQLTTGTRVTITIPVKY